MTEIRRWHMNGQEDDVWVKHHPLMPVEGRLRRLRPIHVLTYLAETMLKENRDLRNRTSSCCVALENKLFGVRFFQLQLRRALASIEEPIYARDYSQESDQDELVICVLEAYLNAIYTSLEQAAKINRILHIKESLPAGFRDQSKKYKLFSFAKSQWLGVFYDLRTELAHFSSAMPHLSGGSLIITFTQNRELNAFKKGKYEIPFEPILGFCLALFQLLDKWAIVELQNVDPEAEIASITETGLHTIAKMETVKAKEILNLLK